MKWACLWWVVEILRMLRKLRKLRKLSELSEPNETLAMEVDWDLESNLIETSIVDSDFGSKSHSKSESTSIEGLNQLNKLWFKVSIKIQLKVEIFFGSIFSSIFDFLHYFYTNWIGPSYRSGNGPRARADLFGGQGMVHNQSPTQGGRRGSGGLERCGWSARPVKSRLSC